MMRNLIAQIAAYRHERAMKKHFERAAKTKQAERRSRALLFAFRATRLHVC